MAMTIKDYEDRIEKLNIKIGKIEKRIKKWKANKSDEKFRKEFEWEQIDNDTWKLGYDGNKYIYGTFEEFKDQYYLEWIKECDEEIRYAERDKKDAIVTMNKYKNAITLLQERDAKPVIQIFKDFFENWKKEIIEYVKPQVELYYETSDKATDLTNGRSRFEEFGFATRQDLLDEVQKLIDKAAYIRKNSFVGIAIEKSYKYNTADFIKFLDDYMNDRYFELVDKITKYVGEIEDVSNLNIGYDGRINGIVIGTEGKAKIETIVAGGYNTDIIVNVKHGQIRHYRVLVHPLK